MNRPGEEADDPGLRVVRPAVSRAWAPRKEDNPGEHPKQPGKAYRPTQSRAFAKRPEDRDFSPNDVIPRPDAEDKEKTAEDLKASLLAMNVQPDDTDDVPDEPAVPHTSRLETEAKTKALLDQRKANKPKG